VHGKYTIKCHADAMVKGWVGFTYEPVCASVFASRHVGLSSCSNRSRGTMAGVTGRVYITQRFRS